MSIAARVAAPVMNSIFIRLERQDRQLAPQTPPPSAANEAPILFQQSRGFGDQLLHLGASAPKMAPFFKDGNYAAGISIRFRRDVDDLVSERRVNRIGEPPSKFAGGCKGYPDRLRHSRTE